MSRRSIEETTRLLQEALGETYTIIERIGGGGMGDVYLAQHKTLGGKWAIKILSEELAKEPVLVTRFIDEAKIEANLQHPNIVKVFDIGQRKEFYYLVMSYVEGEDLDARMTRQGAMEPGDVVAIALQVTKALECAHDNGIIHRDLKPSNIRIDQYGTVVVMDFGIARVRDAALHGKTAIGEQLGTPLYMSPEQAAGRTVDVRSDLYSLGVMLYEMLAGENPFAAENQYAIGIRHLTAEAPPLTEFRSDLPVELSNIVARLLTKDPELRYQTAKELRQALSPIRLGVDTRTPMPSVKTPRKSLLTQPISPLDETLHRVLDYSSAREFSSNEQFILGLADGRRTVEEIVTLSSLGEADVVAAVETLKREGAVYTEPPEIPAEQLPPLGTPKRPPRPPSGPRRTKSYPQMRTVAEGKIEPILQPAETARVPLSLNMKIVLASIALFITVTMVIIFWPEPAPHAIQVDASPWAEVTIRSSKGEVVHREVTPFQVNLRLGAYNVEFKTEGKPPWKEELKIGSKPPSRVWHNFWTREQTRSLLSPLSVSVDR